MRILIDIGHPSHVHLFKNFAHVMLSNGHKVLFTVKKKEFEIELLKFEKFDYYLLGNHCRTTIGKILGLFKFNFRLFFLMLRFKPDITLSHGSMYAAQVSWILRIPHISFEDTFNFEQIRLYKPFAKVILTKNYNHPYLGQKNIKYCGYHELAYLHPVLFKANSDIINELGLKKGEPFVILRFVSWSATHDRGQNGLTIQNKLTAIKEFSKYARVFISSESPLPEELKKFSFTLPPEKMHHAIAFSSLVFGESATMASEAAILGVPAIYLDKSGRYYTKEQEYKYGLVFNFTISEEDQIISIKKGIEILKNTDAEYWKVKQKILSKDNINVTSFLVWFIENYPESISIMKNNPEYQYNFK